MITADVACVLDFSAKTGEGAIWSVAEQALYWVDIPAGLFCRFDPSTGENKVWDMGCPIGCFALKRSGGAIVALTGGFFDFDFEKQALSLIVDTEADVPSNRFNDGTVDLRGRLLAGTMPISGPDPDGLPRGTLYCLDKERAVTTINDGYFVINGLAFSPDGRTAYVSDSAAWVQTIWAYDYDLDDGAWTNKRTFFDCSAVPGRPDGGAIDADGCYWMAGVSGWQLVRITPDGKVDMEIRMPVEKPTRIAFGGENLDTLYVTSIGPGGISPGTEAQQPQAGGLFALRVPGVQGVEFPMFDG
ncbi:MAG: SMP-30/gluconolactonase/LRE family protein [Rhodospirillales bacterium]|nr:SMP-30/gluconolactonase/LRE family protein [Rhodospirillales bacterium]